MSNQPPSGPEPQPDDQPPPFSGPPQYGQQPQQYAQQPYGQQPQPYGSQPPYGQPTPNGPDFTGQPPAWGAGAPSGYGQQAGYSPVPGGPPAGSAPGGGMPPPYQPSYGQFPPDGQGPAVGPPVPPPRKSGVPKVAVIVGAGVLALILIVVSAALLLNRGSAPSAGQTGATVPAQPTTKASDAVKGYLDALAAGRAEAALAFGKDQPTDKTLLTDAVLADSLKRAPITEINVPEVNDKYAYQVAATYKMGGQSVSKSFTVSDEGDGFRLASITQDIDLSSVRSDTVPLLINGQKVTADQVTVLPGSYALTTGIANISYGAKSTVLITDPNDYPSARPTPTLTKAGRDAFVKGAEAAMNACLKKHELAPRGCPFGLTKRSNQKVNAGSIRWKLIGNPWANLKPRLDDQNPATATASAPMTFSFRAAGSQDGRPVTFSQKDYEYVEMYGAVTTSPVKVSFE